MPAFGNLVLNNGAATPVAKTFEPVKIDGDMAKYAEKSGSIPAGFPRLAVALTEPKNSSGNYRGYVQVKIPRLDPVTFAKIGEDIATIQIQRSSTSTSAQVDDLLAFTANALKSTELKSVFSGLQNIY